MCAKVKLKLLRSFASKLLINYYMSQMRKARVSVSFLIGLSVETVFLRVAATVGISAHIIFGESGTKLSTLMHPHFPQHLNHTFLIDQP